MLRNCQPEPWPFVTRVETSPVVTSVVEGPTSPLGLSRSTRAVDQCFMFLPHCRWFNSQSRSITDWLYEIKHDGFRALAVIEQGQCRFLSRKKHKLTGHQDLRAVLVKEVNAETAVLDGELVVVDHLGRSVFADMVQRRHPARYFAFDLLSLNGQDLTKLLLLIRKEKLKRIL